MCLSLKKVKFATSIMREPSTGVKKMTFFIWQKFHEFSKISEKMIPLLTSSIYPCLEVIVHFPIKTI